LAPKHEFEYDVKLDVEARVRQGVKAVLEEVLQDEMTQHWRPATGNSPPPDAGSATTTAHAISSPPRVRRSSIWRCPGIARASLSRRSSNVTSG
jgi:hypothetical protein